MIYSQKCYNELGVVAEISTLYQPEKVAEIQTLIHVLDTTLAFSQQVLMLCNALRRLLADELLLNSTPIFAQCFLSDAANQLDEASLELSKVLNCTISCVKQPPLDGSRLALWVQLQSDVEPQNDGLILYEHNGYKQYFTSDYCVEKLDRDMSAYHQTKSLLEGYEEELRKRNCTIEKDCVRTWFYVRDIDQNYKQIVDARKENFEQNGLNCNTHYIASTGIEGCTSDSDVKVIMNTYAIKGLDKGQINFLYARNHLNPTYEYGVTFERGVYIDFGDRRKVYISGTASIDNKGLIVHPGDIVKQVYRMWENVEALLDEAGCGFDDLMQLIVYLRDFSDYPIVKKMHDDKFPNIPGIIVLAPVCRPGWLIEMECIAAKPIRNFKYRDF